MASAAAAAQQEVEADAIAGPRPGGAQEQSPDEGGARELDGSERREQHEERRPGAGVPANPAPPRTGKTGARRRRRRSRPGEPCGPGPEPAGRARRPPWRGVYNRENPRRRGRVTGERRLETPRRPVSEPDENDDLPFTRSSIAAIGARRRWRLFGKDEDPGEPAGPSGPMDEPPTRGMLASLAEAAPSGPRDEPPSRNSRAPASESRPLARVPIDDEPPTHGMLASLAEDAPSAFERRVARSRQARDGGRGAAVRPGPEIDEPPTRGMLASLADLSPEPPAERETRRSVLSLDGAAGPQANDTVEPLLAPLTAHSTLAELAGLEEHVPRALPIERGVLISLAAHLLLVVLLITVPAHVAPDPKQGLLAAFLPAEKDTSPIPVIFQESPGQARPNPKRSPLSDADRRASGGDPSRPRSESPFVPPSRGIAGLAPGPRSPRSPAREAARPGSARGREPRGPRALEEPGTEALGVPDGHAAAARVGPARDLQARRPRPGHTGGRAQRRRRRRWRRAEQPRRGVRRFGPGLLRHEVVRLGAVRRRDGPPHQAPLARAGAGATRLEGQPDRALLHPGRRQRGRREDHPRFGHPAVRFRGPAGDPDVLPVSPAAQGPQLHARGSDRNLLLQHASRGDPRAGIPGAPGKGNP